MIIVPVWRRLRRRTMAPGRPALFPDQYALAIVTGLVLLGSIALVLWAVLRLSGAATAGPPAT